MFSFQTTLKYIIKSWIVYFSSHFHSIFIFHVHDNFNSVLMPTKVVYTYTQIYIYIMCKKSQG